MSKIMKGIKIEKMHIKTTFPGEDEKYRPNFLMAKFLSVSHRDTLLAGLGSL
jgi:hypothetical protein